MDRLFIRDKKRIVVKIGTSTITHEETGALNLVKMEKLVRLLTDLRSCSCFFWGNWCGKKGNGN